MHKFFAHRLEGQPEEQWHRLRDHLQATAELAAEFAKPFGAEAWAYLAGLWHDLGKYSEDFQRYLKGQTDACG